MPTPLPIPPKIVIAIALVALAGCQPSSAHPVPSVPQIGGDLKCSQGDHGYEDPLLGWGFCYPGTWKYTERSQASQSPRGVDLTFDITFVPPTPGPCPSASIPPSASPLASPASPAAPASPCAGDFAYMIISTYDRGGAGNLATWMSTNLKATSLQTISWGNSLEAARLSDGRRIALTPHDVVILDLRSGLLDLETEMSARLGTWKFSY
jgi:hypothetical protein